MVYPYHLVSEIHGNSPKPEQMPFLLDFYHVGMAQNVQNISKSLTPENGRFEIHSMIQHVQICSTFGTQILSHVISMDLVDIRYFE